MFKMPKWSADNPLGIIALFISLIYGMSALLLGASVDSLEPHNETILVIFTVAFPFIVLGVFGWLVACHHKKLYGPKDYQSDEGFLIANTNEDPASLGKRLRREISEEDDGSVEEPADAVIAMRSAENEAVAETSENDDGGSSGDSVSPTSPSSTALREAYLIESLVFQELQSTLGGSVLREVSLLGKKNRRFRADGVIQNRGMNTLVEVKLMQGGSTITRVRRVFEQFLAYQGVIEDAIEPIDFLAVFVSDNERFPFDKATSDEIQRLSSLYGIPYMLFEYSDLMKKYGLSE